MECVLKKRLHNISRFINIFIFLLFFCFVNNNIVLAESCVEFNSGEGTKNNPYIITSNSELDAIRCNLNSYFELGNDLDLTYDTQNENGLFYNNGKGWIPIGNVNYPFKGNLNGNGYKITGLKINRANEDYIGLFGYIKGAYNNKLFINDLGLENANIEGYKYVGSIAGYSEYLSIEKSYNTGNIVGSHYVGGIIGSTSSTDILKVYNAGDVKSDAYTGGLVGTVLSVNINDSYNTGNIYGDSDVMGGIGGIVGSLFKSSNINNVINYGNIYGKNDLLMRKGIYEIGKSGMIVGLYNGEVSDNVKNAYFFNKYGVVTNEFGEELSKENLIKTENYKNFDFDNVWKTNNNGYPVLKNMNSPVINLDNNYFPNSKGTKESPYMISTPSELDFIRYDLTGYYILNDNINLTYDTQNENGLFYNNGKGWIPIGNEDIPFYGVLDGEGHYIKGLHINNNLEYNGLFGYTKNANIRNINLLKMSIESTRRCGAAAGAMSASKANNIIISGSLHCNYQSGGLSSYIEESSVNGVINYANIYGNEIGGLAAIISKSKVSNFVNYKEFVMTENGQFYYGSLGNRVIKNSNINNIFNFGSGGGIFGYLAENSIITNAMTVKGKKFYYTDGWQTQSFDVPYRSIDSTSSIENVNEYHLTTMLNDNNLLAFDMDDVLTVGNGLPTLNINSDNQKNLFITGKKVNSYYNQKIDYDITNQFQKIMSDNNKNDNLIDYEIIGFPVVYNNTQYSSYPYEKYINSPFVGKYYYTILMYGSENVAISNLEFNIEPKITDIEIESFPTKIQYNLNDTFSDSGIKIIAKYNDGSTKNVEKYTISNPDMSKLGSQSVVVSVDGVSKTFNIFINGIYFDTNKGLIKPNEQFSISYNAKFADSNVTLIWESSDTSIATVDENGKVTALKEGKVNISLKSSSGIKEVYKLIVSEYKIGDLNGNNKIDLSDVIILLKRFINPESITDEILLLGDMNNNGKLDLSDVIMLLKRYINGGIE